MDSLNLEIALYSIKNECAGTDTVFYPISEVSTWLVWMIHITCWNMTISSLKNQYTLQKT